MRNYTDEQLQLMSIYNASNVLSNRVYEATGLIEQLEFRKAKDGGKRIRSNGHHLRQEIAEFAKKLLKENWEE